MTDTHTTPPTTAATSTPRRTTSRPTVSVRPAAVGALNAATIAGATAVAAGGGAVLAALAGGGALAATALGARKQGQAKAKQERAITITRTAGSTGRAGGLGRSGAASPGSRSAGSRSGAGRSASGRSGGGSGKSTRGGGLLGRSGGGSSGGGRSTAGKPSAGRSGRANTSGGHRRAGSRPGSASRSPLTADKVAAARRKLANRRQPGPRLSDAVRSALKPAPTPYGTPSRKPTAREAFAAARRAVTGDNPKNRGPVRRAVAGLVAGGIAAGTVAYKRRALRKRMAKARAARNARIIARLSNTSAARQGVARTVRQRPVATNTTAAHPTTTPVVKPAPITTPLVAATTAAPATGGTAMSRILLALSEEFLEAAGRNKPEGMLQVTAEAHMLPQILDNLARAMKLRYDQALKQPMHPAIKDMYGAIHKNQVAVCSASEDIGPSLERVHKDELDRLRNPNMRGDESMWDVAKNRGVA